MVDVKIFRHFTSGFLIRWLSPGLKYGKTETAFRDLETPSLRHEVPFVIAEMGPLP